MSDIKITREENGSKGRYVARIDGVDGEGEMTFSTVSEKLFIIDHTGVPDSMRGMGVTGALAKHVVEDARAKGQKIIPLCPFFRSYVERHKEETSDVIQDR